MDKFSYTWSEKFTTQKNETTTLEYPKDFTTGDHQLTWGLKTIFNPTDTDSKDYVSIFLYLLKSNDNKSVWANFKFTLFDTRGKKIESLESRKPYKFVQGKSLGFKKFIGIDFLISSLLMSNNKCTYIIKCEITYLSSELDLMNEVMKYEEPEYCLPDDLWLMLDNKKFSDVTFNVCGKEFKVHKVILSARSPVFYAMFDNEMRESKLNQVDVTDVDPEVFEEMIHFIYTGKSPKIETMVG